MTQRAECTARLVDLVDTSGVLIEGFELPSHACSVRLAIDEKQVDAPMYALNETTALAVSSSLDGLGSDGEMLTVIVEAVRSSGRTARALRSRLACLMAVHEDSLMGWDEREVRHALLFVLEAADGSLRDQRLVALEAALGASNTL